MDKTPHSPKIAQAHTVLRRMTARSPDEAHRTSTPLELLFDLVFVTAIAYAGAQLHHAIAANHIAHGVVSYALVFFTIWWAWMNFSWFASAFDNDDVAYRIAVFVQMAGALVIASGVSAAFEGHWLTVALGYCIMRVALVAQWLRAGLDNPLLRPTTSRYAAGIFLIQLAWLASAILAPSGIALWLFVLMISVELLIPMWAEHTVPSPWHPHHISERYGLLTLIVLGESILSTGNAVQNGMAQGLMSANFALFCLGALLVIFCMWWVYFEEEGVAHQISGFKTGFFWGYGHFFIFASAAAAGAGLAAQVDYRLGLAQVSATVVGYGLALPVASYVFFTWLIHKRIAQAKGAWVFPLSALLVLITPWLHHYTTIAIGVILVFALILRTALVCQRQLR